MILVEYNTVKGRVVHHEAVSPGGAAHEMLGMFDFLSEIEELSVSWLSFEKFLVSRRYDGHALSAFYLEEK